MFPVHSTDMGSSSSSHYLPFNQIAPMFETINHRKEIDCYYENFPLGIINNNISESFNESSVQNNAAATPCMQYGVELRNNYLTDDGLGALDQCHPKRVGSVFLRADHVSETKRQRMIRNRQSAARSRARKLVIALTSYNMIICIDFVVLFFSVLHFIYMLIFLFLIRLSSSFSTCSLRKCWLLFCLGL